MNKFKAGDKVYHYPTQEEWFLALDQEDTRVYWCGYPFSGSALASDCKLIESSSKKLRINTLKDIIKCNHYFMSDKAKRQLEVLNDN